MTPNISDTEKESKAQLENLISELSLDLEEKFWKDEVPSRFKVIFEDAAKIIEQRLELELNRERNSLTRLTEYYAKKKPQEVLELLSRVDRSRFDGGHVLSVGVGFYYKYKTGSYYHIGHLALWFDALKSGVVRIPFYRRGLLYFHSIQLSSFSDSIGLKDTRERVAVYTDQEIHKINPGGTKPDSIILPSGMQSDEWDQITKVGWSEHANRESDRNAYARMVLRDPGNAAYWRNKLRGTGLDDDEINHRVALEDIDDTDYMEDFDLGKESDDEYYYRMRLMHDPRFKPFNKGDHASGADLG